MILLDNCASPCPAHTHEAVPRVSPGGWLDEARTSSIALSPWSAARPITAPNTQRRRTAGQSTRRAPARAAANHKSLDVDAMLHVISDGDSDTGSAAGHACEAGAADSDIREDVPHSIDAEVRNDKQCWSLLACCSLQPHSASASRMLQAGRLTKAPAPP